jgi:hypothetical protein
MSEHLPGRLMVFGTLVLPARTNRITNIALGIVYAVTITVGAVGATEWRAGGGS